MFWKRKQSEITLFLYQTIPDDEGNTVWAAVCQGIDKTLDNIFLL